MGHGNGRQKVCARIAFNTSGKDPFLVLVVVVVVVDAAAAANARFRTGFARLRLLLFLLRFGLISGA